MNLERIILLFRPDLVAFKTILEDEVAEWDVSTRIFFGTCLTYAYAFASRRALSSEENQSGPVVVGWSSQLSQWKPYGDCLESQPSGKANGGSEAVPFGTVRVGFSRNNFLSSVRNNGRRTERICEKQNEKLCMDI